MMYYPMKSLYVGDLESGANEGDLRTLFSQVEGLVSIKICRDRISGESLRYAYVNYTTPAQAEMALRTLNHKPVKGKPVRIMWIKRDPYSRKTGSGNLYVKNLEMVVTTAEMESVFSEYGSVVSCKLVYDKYCGRSSQFGFVQMCSDESAEKAISALHGNTSTILSSKSLYVAKFVKKSGRKKNLYVKNLEGSVTSEALRERFSEFGQVASAVVMRDERGISRGFGFVSFEQSRDAQSALSAMNGSTWGSKECSLYVALAQKKAEREALLRREFTEISGVYVGNLEESVSAEDLKQLFASCGNVVSAKVVLGANRRSRGFGFVYLSTPKAAQCAITMDGTSILKKRPIIVKPAFRKIRSRSKSASTAKRGSSSRATQPYYYPSSYQPMSIYHVPSMAQNPWVNSSYPMPSPPNYAYTPSPNYPYTPSQPVAATPYSYFDPASMQYFQVQPNTPASAWKVGYGGGGSTPVPVVHYSNSGKKRASRSKTKGLSGSKGGKAEARGTACSSAEFMKRST